MILIKNEFYSQVDLYTGHFVRLKNEGGFFWVRIDNAGNHLLPSKGVAIADADHNPIPEAPLITFAMFHIYEVLSPHQMAMMRNYSETA